MDIEMAISIAVPTVAERLRSPADAHILTGVQQFVRDGKYVWRVTFKPARLLSKEPSREPLGLGGEVFVDVDLNTGTTEIRYGE
ncbi:MAG: hypothetical protein FJ280_13280 [Planctomycetes bacterium]|nr:hypothetical protein [Planctomycetota bacterium]